MRACNAGGCGPWSSTHNVTVTVLLNVTGLTARVTRFEDLDPWFTTGNPAPVAPGVDSAQAVMPMRPPPSYTWQLGAQWSEATGATYYEVKVHNNSNGTTHTYNVSYTLLPTKEVDNQYVEVSVRACNANGCTAWAGPVDPTVYY